MQVTYINKEDDRKEQSWKPNILAQHDYDQCCIYNDLTKTYICIMLYMHVHSCSYYV